MRNLKIISLTIHIKLLVNVKAFQKMSKGQGLGRMLKLYGAIGKVLTCKTHIPSMKDRSLMEQMLWTLLMLIHM